MFLINSAFATSFFIRPFSEFTRMTPIIVRGTIRNVFVDHTSNMNGEKEIYTFAEVDLKEVIKGDIEAKQITIRKLGGTKDGITLEIPSSVEFKVGVESVFFLDVQQADHSYEVSGMELGRFDIEQKNGSDQLKGGLFLYSQPQSKDESHFVTENIKENQKPWSLGQLRELVAQQGISIPKPQPSPELKNNLINSANKDQGATESPIPPPQTEPPFNSLQLTQEDKTPLYFEPALWYTLAILILTLGAIKYMRRG